MREGNGADFRAAEPLGWDNIELAAIEHRGWRGSGHGVGMMVGRRLTPKATLAGECDLSSSEATRPAFDNQDAKYFAVIGFELPLQLRDVPEKK